MCTVLGDPEKERKEMELFTQIIGVVTLIAIAALNISLMIPGEQPDKFLAKVVKWLKALSNHG